MNIRVRLQVLVEEAAQKLGFALPIDVELTPTTRPEFGDYSTNVALQLFSLKGSGQPNPRALAAALIVEIDKLLATETVLTLSFNEVAKVEMAGPGFINFTLTEYFFLEHLAEQLRGQDPMPDWLQRELAGQRIIVEFTDPNPFKELHIGHAYSNIVGESICRLLEAAGAIVHRVCYQGDVGMHVAKSVWGLRALLAEQGQASVAEQLESLAAKETPSELVKLLGRAYAKGASAYEQDETVKGEIRDINYLTYLSAQENLVDTENWQPQVDYSSRVDKQSTDYETVKLLYNTGRQWSMEYFELMYERLGMRQSEQKQHFDDYFPESIVGEYGLKIVKEYLAKGVFQESQGAIIFVGSEQGLHDRVFVNSLGLPTYEAKELGLAPEKYRRWPYDASIIITGNEIKEYFKVLLAALTKVSPDLAKKTTHLSHGMVRLPEGKMSSRTGKILTAEWLLDEAEQKIYQVMAETKPDLAEAQKKTVAKVVGLAAVKYAFLKQSVGGDIAFSFDESLSFTGQAGPYLEYTFVRCQSVLAKAKAKVVVDKNFVPSVKDDGPLEGAERALVVSLSRFGDAVYRSIRERAPHYVAQYLFELAQSFSGFYTQCPILVETNPVVLKRRLALTEATAQVMSRGLGLLGIATVDHM